MNSTAGSSLAPTAQQPGASVQEYSIKVPKDTNKKYHVMRFNGVLNVDFTKWSQVKLERENNLRDIKVEEEMPKFGAGSEFGREAKDEARRKKYGIIAKKYKPEDQPWILKSGGKTGKKFKGVREGGVGENAAYYVFTHGKDGALEAFPLTEWYNFQPIQRYKHLSAEEAEEEFGRRNKVMNYFSLMLQKRLKNTEEGEPEEEGELKKGTKKKGKKEKDLKISDMDEWMDSDVDESSDEDGDGKKDEDDEDDEKKKKKKKKEQAKKNLSKKKKKGSDESAFEESDDGDEEGRELDYISDSSEDVSDHEEKARKELSGVTEEKALRKLLNSDDEDDEDEDEEEEKKSEPEDEEKEEKEKEEKKEKKKKKTKDKKTKGKEAKDSKETKDEKATGEKEKAEESPSSVSSDSSDDEGKKKSNPSKSNGKPADTNSAETNSNAKRAIAAASSSQENPAKKARLDPINFNDSGISEEAVRRYLIRKPMTATELLQKFKRPKTNLSSEQLVTVMTSILKRINPTKQTIKNKMYLSLKPS
ncbi:general transcription factor IIF subunit 1 [Diaphorina citri]|uniref:Transcription initiation factor IIF subunit alpha n=1 Tax=Diaphorina citri TaxID=121845 RepID=A0A1S4EJJ7_DIACI|nr:general transcription factor IIF subunit 1 [Diaphorina citri]